MNKKKRKFIGLAITLLIIAGCSTRENQPVSEQSSDASITKTQKTDHEPMTSQHKELPDQFNEDGYLVNIYTSEESYSIPVEEISMTIESAGGSIMAAGESVRLEKLEGDIWHRISF